jgi:hypothetical protein
MCTPQAPTERTAAAESPSSLDCAACHAGTGSDERCHHERLRHMDCAAWATSASLDRLGIGRCEWCEGDQASAVTLARADAVE